MLNITSNNDLASLDPKNIISFFEDKLNFTQKKKLKLNSEGKGMWSVDNFLTKDECDKIIKKCEEKKFDNLDSRKRLITFDENGNLLNFIQKKIKYLINKKKLENIQPYGFYKSNWKMNGNVNQCLRINKYEKDDHFNWHRDSQFTESKFSRSNYTLIIYLNDDFEDGSTVFKIPNESIVHDGRTIQEELNNNFIERKIIPKTGKAIIFDQRLIHKSDKVNGTKYILRTDILSFCKKIEENSQLVNEIELLTKKLFRQAQLLELQLKNQETEIKTETEIETDTETKTETNKKINELYEIVLSLRQDPFKLDKVPDHLNNLLTIINENNDFNNQINFEKRNSNEYFFNYKNINKIDALIVSSLFTIYYSNKYLENPNDCLKKHLENLNINIKIDDEKFHLNDEIIYKNIEDDHYKFKIHNDLNNESIDNHLYFLTEEFKKIGYNYSFNYENENYIDYEYMRDFDKNNMNFPKQNDDKNVENIILNLEGDEICAEHTCYMCRLGQHYKLLDNIKFNINEKFNSTFIFKKLVENNDHLEGEIIFNLPSKSYNHASCQSDDYEVYNTRKISKNMDVFVKFKLYENKIIIDLNFGIIL